MKLVQTKFKKISETYGLPTAKQQLLTQMQNVMKSQGLNIGYTHFKLLVSAMTASGDIKGLNRSGVMLQNNGIIAKASFEVANKIITNAAISEQVDYLKGPFEATVINKPAQIGTKLVKINLKDSIIK